VGKTLFALAVDPGMTTGWAVIGVPEGSIYGNEKGAIEEFETGEVMGNFTGQARGLAHIARRFQNVKSPNNIALIIEDFDPRHHVRSEEYLSPVKLAAMLTYATDMGHLGGITGPFWQMPSLAKETATDDRLKAWKLYKPGSEHIKDATRHAITFIRRTKGSKALREQAWALRLAS
jgi:hypothetical protein